MGLFSMIKESLKREESPPPPAREPILGINISAPRPAPGQSDRRMDYHMPDFDEEEEATIGVDASGLPTYDHLFPNGPYQWFHDPPAPGEGYRRRIPGVPDSKKRPIPIEVLEILCKHRAIDSCTMAKLARVNHAYYRAVIPDLYHRLIIHRYSLPKILYGIPLPISSFTFDPNAVYDKKGKKKQVYHQDDVIPPMVERRKRRCLSLVKELILEEPILDWPLCQSIIMLREPNHPAASSFSRPVVKFFPMREPAEGSTPSTTSTNTTLMPNVETVSLSPGISRALSSWEETAKTSHHLLDAIASLCNDKSVRYITLPVDDGKASSEPDSSASTSEEVVKDFISEINDKFGSKREPCPPGWHYVDIEWKKDVASGSTSTVWVPITKEKR
jgi:hypothetical protein